ncbi:Malate dehydrogenase [Sulfitobacter noctilucicola]|uniref:Malate dehydrogenase n=1 Tax=Sulfitobacter noctilucicola TaxID=1342301 RepID=A0A7W6Q7R4_9RHOB|nr:malate dehydrogenase [Sulfitobacter noctilucicola]KIN70234.1 Malate dehydrogenase [Sulfitobacter noctilucicola]MBB4176137.1 malate dehydrogenase [Sulfitobacter noctilucicola]
MTQGRVIGTDTVEDARQRGRLIVEVMPGDIVTALARESAERLGLKLVDGPVEMPAPVRTDGATSMRRTLYRRAPKWQAPSRSPRKARRLGKLALIGAGGVGGNIAHLTSRADMAEEIVLIDIAPGMAAATALDLNHTSGITGAAGRCIGGETLDLVSGAEVIVVTAGRARSPGMTRADLIDVNARVIRQAGEAIRSEAPNAVVIVVTNPLDEMTTEMLRVTGFPRERVLGMAGTLDSSRFRNALAMMAGVSPADVDAITLGSHGEEMAPIPSRATIKGRPLNVFLSEEQVKACVKDAITGGGQVVALKKSGSATIAPAHATIELIDHMRGARTGPVPVSVMLNGEYGIDDVVLGVPAHLGQGGMIKIEELRLTEAETAALHTAADAIRTRLAT